MNEEEKKAVDKAIYELEDSYELHQREWAKKCLNTIKHGFTKLQKENEELKNDYENLNNSVVVKNHCIKNSIPVKKVKDKIEEILNNGEYRIIFEGDTEIPDEATIINAQKYIKLEKLQELLEGRK